VPDLRGYQNYGRDLSRSKQPARVEFETRSDLLTYMRSHALPSTFDEMDDSSFYTVDGIAAIWSDFVEPDGSCTLAIPLITVPDRVLPSRGNGPGPNNQRFKREK